MTGPSFQIIPVRSPADLAATVQLFHGYAASIGIDLAYQDFPTEVATLPGLYAPPRGEVLLARDDAGEPVGCAALRPMEQHGCCEMKRLFVLPEGRGIGLGRALIEGIIREAARIGYREIRLDTLPDMAQAIALYPKMGFEPIEAYYSTPVAGTKFFRRVLSI